MKALDTVRGRIPLLSKGMFPQLFFSPNQTFALISHYKVTKTYSFSFSSHPESSTSKSNSKSFQQSICFHFLGSRLIPNIFVPQTALIKSPMTFMAHCDSSSCLTFLTAHCRLIPFLKYFLPFWNNTVFFHFSGYFLSSCGHQTQEFLSSRFSSTLSSFTVPKQSHFMLQTLASLHR